MNLEVFLGDVLPEFVCMLGVAALMAGCVVVLFVMIVVMCVLVDAGIDRAASTMGIAADFVAFSAMRMRQAKAKAKGRVAAVNNTRTDFAACCGRPPTVTEWRPGCYGAQCMECGVIMGDERQLSRDQLMVEWNAAMRSKKGEVKR